VYPSPLISSRIVLKNPSNSLGFASVSNTIIHITYIHIYLKTPRQKNIYLKHINLKVNNLVLLIFDQTLHKMICFYD